MKLRFMPGKIYSNPFDMDILLKSLIKQNTIITLIATPTNEVAELERQIQQGQHSGLRLRGDGIGGIKAAAPARTRDWKKVQEESMYTFHAIQPLPYLPNPEKSKRF